MSYKLIVQKSKENENYAVEMAKIEERRGRMYADEVIYPSKEEITNALVVELTDEQFAKVKAEVIKAFE